MVDQVKEDINPNITRLGDITIIKIPELGESAEMRFNFVGAEIAGKKSKEERHSASNSANQFIGLKHAPASGGVLSAADRIRESGLESQSPADREDTEKLLDQMLNYPKHSEKTLQHDFNQLIVKTYANNKDEAGNVVPLIIGTTKALTPSEFGGALLETKDGQPALGVNIESMNQAKYVYVKNVDGKEVKLNHVAAPVDTLRHEFFHFVDPHMKGKSNGLAEEADGESRAVWFVNQFQAARNEPKRASYQVTNDETVLPSIKLLPEVLGDKIPGGDMPSINNSRTYPPIKNDEKKQRIQPQSSVDKTLLLGLAGLSTASELFLKERSGLLPADQARIQSMVDSALEANNAKGKDIVLGINERKVIDTTLASNGEPGLG